MFYRLSRLRIELRLEADWAAEILIADQLAEHHD